MATGLPGRDELPLVWGYRCRRDPERGGAALEMCGLWPEERLSRETLGMTYLPRLPIDKVRYRAFLRPPRVEPA